MEGKGRGYILFLANIEDFFLSSYPPDVESVADPPRLRSSPAKLTWTSRDVVARASPVPRVSARTTAICPLHRSPTPTRIYPVLCWYPGSPYGIFHARRQTLLHPPSGYSTSYAPSRPHFCANTQTLSVVASRGAARYRITSISDFPSRHSGRISTVLSFFQLSVFPTLIISHLYCNNIIHEKAGSRNVPLAPVLLLF